MIFNEENVKRAVYCLLVLCIACSGLKVHTGDTQDQTSSRPNTLFDDADDIQRQLDNEARDRFKYGRPKAIWILNIPTQIPLVTNTLDWSHRRPRNLVSSTTWNYKFDIKSNLNKNNDIELEPNNDNYIETEFKYKNDVEPELNTENILVSESNNKNNIELEQNFDYVIKASTNDNNDLGTPSDINNSMVPGSDIKNDITQVPEYETGTDNNNDSGPPLDTNNLMEPGPDVQNYKNEGPDKQGYKTDAEYNNYFEPPLNVKNDMERGREVSNDIEQELDKQEYKLGTHIHSYNAEDNNYLGPPLSINNDMEPGPEVSNDIEQESAKQEYKTDAEDNNNLGSPLNVKNDIEPGPEVSNDIEQGTDNPNYISGTEDKNDFDQPIDVKNSVESGSDISNDLPDPGPDINNDLESPKDIKSAIKPGPDTKNNMKQGKDNLDHASGTDADNDLGPPLDVKNTMEPGSDSKNDPKEGPNNTNYSTGADNNKILEPPLDVKNTLEPEHGVNNDMKKGPDGDAPTGLPSSLWSYKEQSKWVEAFPHCGLQSQSPVDLPSKGLVAARGARPLTFINYNAMPLQLRLKNDGNTVTLQGDWEEGKQPLIYGGAGHSRRYRFHSMTLHAPSEHSIEKLLFPLETQVLHVSTDYATLDDAVNGSTKDHLAFLGIVNIYKYGYTTEPALKQLLKVAAAATPSSGELRVDNAPLSTFCPPFGQYACYHGSLNVPPCTESVLWLVRGRALPLERKVASHIKMASGNRVAQPLNDRRVFLFDKI